MPSPPYHLATFPRLDEYEGGLACHHFVITGWDDPGIAAVLWTTRRGADNFKRQARRLLIDAAVSLAHWRWNGDRQNVYTEKLDFEAQREVEFVTKLGWRYMIYAVISNVIMPSPEASEQGPPNDTVVYINVQEVRVAQNEGEEEAIGWIENWRRHAVTDGDWRY